MPNRSFFVALFSLLTISGFSQTFKPAEHPEKMLAELKKTAELTNSIQTDFKEEKHLSVLKEPQISSGLFYYKKNDKMRWEQQSPFKYILLINGNKLRVQDSGKEKNMGAASRMAAQIKELMIGLVNGDVQENKAFAKTYMESADSFRVTLIPLNKRLKNIYSKITLVFPKGNLRLRELTFYEKGGDKSIMKFQNEKINQSLPDGLFTNF